MKINRLKRTQATLTFYRNNFGFHPPYKILIDRTFCSLCLKLGFDLNIQLTKYLQSDVQLFTTRCVIKELEKIGDSVKDALKLIKTFKLKQCVHSELEIRPSKCFLSIIDHELNDEHFFIATQDIKLIKKLNNKIASPYLSIKLNAIFLNKPTIESKVKAKQILDSQLTTDYELNKLKEVKKIELGTDENESKLIKKRKKIKGPNPLSCRKKQIKENKETEPTSDKKRRNHKHKISKHIRKLLKKNNVD